jgi:hypothetical protein
MLVEEITSSAEDDKASLEVEPQETRSIIDRRAITGVFLIMFIL